jgi:hypothetical protein
MAANCDRNSTRRTSVPVFTTPAAHNRLARLDFRQATADLRASSVIEYEYPWLSRTSKVKARPRYHISYVTLKACKFQHLLVQPAQVDEPCNGCLLSVRHQGDPAICQHAAGRVACHLNDFRLRQRRERSL